MNLLRGCCKTTGNNCYCWGAGNKWRNCIAFSPVNLAALKREDFSKVTGLPIDMIDPLFEATVQATEEAIINAMITAETMEGINGNKSYALPQQLVIALLKNITG